MSLSPGIDSSVADLLIKSRETQPFVSVSAFVGHPLVRFLTLATDDLTVTSSYFELKANARNERIDYRESVYLSVTSSKLRVLHRWREDFDE